MFQNLFAVAPVGDEGISMLKLNGRIVQEEAKGYIEFICPDAWKQASREVRDRYSGMHFSRKVRQLESTEQILPVGNAAIKQALKQAKTHEAFVASVSRHVLGNPLVIDRITDAVTGEKRNISSVIAAVVLADGDQHAVVLKDWEVLQRLNALTAASGFSADESPAGAEAGLVDTGIQEARRVIEGQMTTFDLPFRKPALELFACRWPGGKFAGGGQKG